MSEVTRILAAMERGDVKAVEVVEKCLKVGKSVKSLGKVTKNRAQKLVGMLKSFEFFGRSWPQ